MSNGRRYTDEEHEFLRNFIPGHKYKEIISEFNKQFVEITESQLKGYIQRKKILTGFDGRFKKGHIPKNKGTHPPTVGRMAETQFKKGHVPQNTKPIGYERINKDGYIEVKVRMSPDRITGKKNFVLKHRLVWESTYGPIPKGYNVIFLDGNKQNCTLDNLSIISRREAQQMTKKKLWNKNPKLTQSGTLIARVAALTENKRKKLFDTDKSNT